MKQRESKYELLRFVAIVFITLNHINTYCDVRAIGISHPFNLFLSLLFGAGGKFGCNVFLLISAWFLAKKNGRPVALIRIFCQVMFYLFLLDAVWLVITREGLTLHRLLVQLAKTLTGGHYWYAFAYFIFLLAVPVLRSFMDRIRHPKAFLLIAGLLICVLPTFTMDYLLIPGRAGALCHRIFSILMYDNVVWFLFVFCLIYYVRSRGKLPKISAAASAVLFAASYVIMVFIIYKVYLAGAAQTGALAERIASNYYWLRNGYSLLCFISSAALFGWLHQVNVRFSPLINRLGAYTFGMYLLQTHPLMKEVFYNGIFDFPSIYENRLPIVYFLTGCLLLLIIVLIGCAIEVVRSALERRLLGLGMVTRVVGVIERCLNGIYSFADRVLAGIFRA